MTDLGQIIKDSVDSNMNEGFLKEAVDKKVKDLIESVVNDQLRSYGDIGKQVSEAVKESLKVPNLDLPSFGSLMMNMLREEIETNIEGLLKTRIVEDTVELLNIAPKKVKLSKIVEDMIERNVEYSVDAYGDVVTCIIGDNSHGYTWIYLDEDTHYRDDEKYQCATRLLVCNETGEIRSCEYKGEDLSGKRRAKHGSYDFGLRSHLADQILRYYACGTVLEIDEDEISTFHDPY